MNQNIQLKLKRLPQALGELAHWNQFLKMSAFSSYAFCSLMALVLFYQATKPALVLTLAPDATIYQTSHIPQPEMEIERAVREYLKYRYNWEPRTVHAQLKEAQAFILPATRKAFEASVSNISKFAADKLLAQRVYPDKIQIDVAKGLAAISGDRITMIQGLKAAGDLRLELAIESGPRTPSNPWGVYISREKEQQ